jgi:hypothetical protein
MHMILVTQGPVFFLKQGGWLDLLGSMPSLGLVFRGSGILPRTFNLVGMRCGIRW